MEMSRDNDQKKTESPYMEMSGDNRQKVAYISNELQPVNHSLSFNVRNYLLLSATSILSRSSMAYNTTASLDKLTCISYLDFGKCQDRFGRFSWSKNDSSYLDVKLKVFKKNDNKEFRLVQKFTMGDADFSQFMRLRNQQSLQQKTWLGRKTWPQCWYLQCPKTWMNNWNWLTR